MPRELEPEITAPEYTGDIPALGSLQLTKLAKSFEQLEEGQLDDLFPSEMVEERTIIIEQVIEGLGIMPVVDYGVPAGNWVEPDRTRTFRESPLVLREDDFIAQDAINQLRKVGTTNQQSRPEEIVAKRVQKMTNRHKRTLDKFRADILLGGINHYDPRTNRTINVDTQIPDHNFFKFNGYDADKNAGADLTSEFNIRTTMTSTEDETGSLTVRAANSLSPGMKKRREAFLFMDNEGRYAGVPWTDRRCDVVRCLRLITQFLYRTNKNRFTEIVMSSDMKTLLHENEYISQFMGVPGMVVADQNKVSTNTAGGPFTSSLVTFGSDGEVATLAGLRVRVLDGLYRDPADSTVKNYWPNHRVALVAPRHFRDPSATLGMTHHCVAEAPDASPGVWMRSGPDQQPPSPPGRTMQMGDAFLPFAVYPHWIAVLDVAEENAISDNLILSQDLTYGTF